MDSKKRKEKILKQINKEHSISKNKEFTFETPKKVKTTPKKESTILKDTKKKPMFSNDKVLKETKIMDKIKKEKSSYQKAKEANETNPLKKILIKCNNIVRKVFNKVRGMSPSARYKMLGAWAVVLVCVIVLVGIIVSSKNQNKKTVSKKEPKKVEETTIDTTQEEATTEAPPQNPLVECADENINNLVVQYLTAMRDVNMDQLKALDMCQDTYANETYFKNTAAVIEDYQDIKVYVKNGPYDGGFMAFVVTNIKFKNIEKTCQGMFEYVIRLDADGSYKIDTTNEDDIEDDDVENRLTQMIHEDDVLALVDSVNQQCQADIASDANLQSYVQGTLNANAALQQSSETQTEATQAPADAAETPEETQAEATEAPATEAPAQ